MKNILLFLILYPFVTQAQFPGPANTVGSTAMYKDSSAFINWANTCVVNRGLQDIAFPNNGFASVGNDTNGTKKAGVNAVVSLGDGGSAILTFPLPISNGVGFDFAVFENAFDEKFLELAFVEVSSDGLNFFRFPATSNTSTLTQIGPFDNVGDASLLNNLAGKYSVNYGTPFDLEDLQGTIGLNLQAITHVKIIDAVGCIAPPYATYDKTNKPINDPYPTAFISGGFDLDAVGVIHQLAVGITENNSLENAVQIYPNPASDFISVYSANIGIKELSITNLNGKVMVKSELAHLSLSAIDAGFYFLKIISSTGESITKKIIKN